MNYRSIADLSDTIRKNLHKLPRDIDLVIGVPRSGMLAANIIALYRNLKLSDIAGYLANAPLKQRNTRKILFEEILRPSEAKHVLVVDDSIYTGGSLERVQALIAELGRQQKITYCTVYSTIESSHKPDVFFEIVSLPRSFEWNMMHREYLALCCLDIDGVLCLDPTGAENDDGSTYIHFLHNVLPLIVPSCKIGHLVTSRLEKYRSETEWWLDKHGIVHEHLHMLDLPDAKMRRRLNCHASFKAEVYRSLKDTELFIESEANQAAEIANMAGKPVLCYSMQKIYYPGVSYALAEKKAYNFAKKVRVKFARIKKRVIDL